MKLFLGFGVANHSQKSQKHVKLVPFWPDPNDFQQPDLDRQAPEFSPSTVHGDANRHCGASPKLSRFPQFLLTEESAKLLPRFRFVNLSGRSDKDMDSTAPAEMMGSDGLSGVLCPSPFHSLAIQICDGLLTRFRNPIGESPVFAFKHTNPSGVEINGPFGRMAHNKIEQEFEQAGKSLRHLEGACSRPRNKMSRSWT